MTHAIRIAAFSLLAFVPLSPLFPASVRAQRPGTAALSAVALRHQDPQWLAMQPFLPDPATGTAERLELAADVLRARRMPEDAIDFYGYALRRGGDDTRVRNKMGITELDLMQFELARMYFQEVLKAHRKDAEAWNNLGAVEHIQGRLRSAVADYNRAIKINKTIPVYHANLATAYFALNDFETGRKEFQRALILDPQLFEHNGSGGTTAHMLSAGDRGRFSFEMARLYALAGDKENMLHSLAQACESGYDLSSHMNDDTVLRRFLKDPRVLVIMRNAHSLRNAAESVASVGKVPALPLITAGP